MNRSGLQRVILASALLCGGYLFGETSPLTSSLLQSLSSPSTTSSQSTAPLTLQDSQQIVTTVLLMEAIQRKQQATQLGSLTFNPIQRTSLYTSQYAEEIAQETKSSSSPTISTSTQSQNGSLTGSQSPYGSQTGYQSTNQIGPQASTQFSYGPPGNGTVRPRTAP